MKIPVVFAFDDDYALPASIAIQSLLESKKTSTEYEVIVFHGGLKPRTIRKMELICPIRWIKADANTLKNAPQGWSGLETYYRLLIADLLPEYDKVIWSDVDVLFKGDLADIYAQDLQGADWGGIIAEKQDEKQGVHPHYSENKKPYVYMPGFMVIDAKLWRQKKMFERFLTIIQKYGKNLRMFDLDILNLAADKIYPVPFEYCVLENIYDELEKAPEWPWLERAQGKEALIKARENPVIIHYAGRCPKIWLRCKAQITEYYWKYIEKSPFYNQNDYVWSKAKALELLVLKILKALLVIKPWRRKVKQRITKLKEQKDKNYEKMDDRINSCTLSTKKIEKEIFPETKFF